jgi:predicted dienelactone hydrolase
MVRGDGTRRTVGAACVAILILPLLALVPPGAGAATSTPTSTPLAVRHVTMTFVDHTRKTVDPGGTRSAPTRTLVTQVYVPRGRGRFPLVVMAHGNAGDPGKLSELLTAWAQAGYVVAAPTFPLTNDLTAQPTVIGD